MNHIQHNKSETETFLFTSESVGEGHPGKIIFFKNRCSERTFLNIVMSFRQDLRSDQRRRAGRSLGAGPGRPCRLRYVTFLILYFFFLFLSVFQQQQKSCHVNEYFLCLIVQFLNNSNLFMQELHKMKGKFLIGKNS
jgi:hypothetical protein